jgi:hypothetical protein
VRDEGARTSIVASENEVACEVGDVGRDVTVCVRGEGYGRVCRGLDVVRVGENIDRSIRERGGVRSKGCRMGCHSPGVVRVDENIHCIIRKWGWGRSK